MDIEIEVFAIFDRDYRSSDEISEFVKNANQKIGQFEVLKVKELENFLLSPKAIHRALNRSNNISINYEEIRQLIRGATDELKYKVLSQLQALSLEYQKSIGTHKAPATIIETVASEFETSWEDLDSRLKIIPGKLALSKINIALQEKRINGLTESKIISSSKREDIDPDLFHILEQLDNFCDI